MRTSSFFSERARLSRRSSAAIGALLILTIVLISATRIAAETAQEHLTRLHSQVSTYGDQVFETSEYNGLAIEKSLFDIQREAHSVSEAAGRANLAYMQRTAGRSNASLESIQVQDDLLDVQIDGLTDYIDTSQVGFKNAYDAANQQETALESSSF